MGGVGPGTLKQGRAARVGCGEEAHPRWEAGVATP